MEIRINMEPNMNLRKIGVTALCCCAIFAVSIPIAAQTMTKAVVAEKIRRVEDGVDEFRKYLERRGDNARNASSTAQQSGRASGRRGTANTEARTATAQAGKDELDDALGDLNSSTNRLRRKFDATEKWIETKAQVERVVDDGRRINQVVARGKYGSDVAKLWATLRNNINDLARAYNVAPLGA
ncbi:hypothetical protein BDD14_2724 [Edaphobacter modestus]|uniref:Uncharacterized protein n=2 Tax=Edaphobacter modestus TaxID=388466 RepID=A0A4Q7YUE2_9BACT|nr:hypothetical protein BDD14_2724 [Edaphobacter modestus]